MRKEKRIQEENRVRQELEHIFGNNLKDVEFCYENRKNIVFVTYQDLEQESLMRDVVQRTIGHHWKLALKRVHTDQAIANFFLQAYRENKIFICQQSGSVTSCEPIRAYALKMMASR